MKTIINARIYDYKNYIENGFVRFDDKIYEVGKMSNFVKNKDDEIIDFEGDLLLPNFVCSHAHIYSIFARGLFSKYTLPHDPTNFQEILDMIWWKLDSKITNDITYYSGIAAASEFLLNGVTTVIDHHASGEILGSLEELSKAVSGVAKMRGIYCFETSDRYNVDECINENIRFLENNKNEKCAGLFGMHASMSLSEKTLQNINKLNKNYPIHIHVAESKMDEDDCENNYNVRIIERLNNHNLLNENSLIVHGVFLNEKELEILAKKNVYIVVNPTSNLNNAVGIANVKAYLEHGIPVMVGNDGLNSDMASEYMNVMYTSHLKNNSSSQLHVGHVQQMILNSYSYVSKMLGIKLGEIKNGFKSDFMRVKYSPYNEMNESNAFAHIFYGLFPSFKPSDVYIDGNQEVKNYSLTNKQLLADLSKCKEYSDILWDRIMEEK